MTTMRALAGGAAALTMGTVLAMTGTAAAATAKKEPPACSAISFRTVPPGTPDGEQDAGLYKSRFAKIELKAEVQGGVAKTYYMVINGKKVEQATTPPALSDGCLTSKNVKLPYQKQPAGSCTGERFRVVIDRSSGKPVAAFFGLQGNAWAYCNATTL